MPQNQEKEKPAQKSSRNSPAETNVATIRAPRRLPSVTYVFDTRATKADLRIPFAVRFNDQKTSEPTRRAAGDTIVIPDVPPGTKVALFLNSDAHPDFRFAPVYEVSVTDLDVHVRIVETCAKRQQKNKKEEWVGGIRTEAAAVDEATKKTNEKARRIEYKAPLHGGIWKQISHRYSDTEAQARLRGVFPDDICAFVAKIYKDAQGASLTFVREAKEVILEFPPQSNPTLNVAGFDLVRDGLTRIHPLALAAVLQAAIEAGVKRVGFSSGWRPSLGSIAHRAGLGLDVARLDGIPMNGEELWKSLQKERKLTSEESESFLDFKSTREAHKKAVSARESAQARRALLELELEDEIAKGVGQCHAPFAGLGGGAEATNASTLAHRQSAASRLADSERAIAEANVSEAAASKERERAEKAWFDYRAKREPPMLREFREKLLRMPGVSQVFDPWLMESNTMDRSRPVINRLRSDNESLHGDHLHVTISDPGILPPDQPAMRFNKRGFRNA